ncbi:signal transduction histidine kinase [Friedmanniella endophytica]|uniref:histidine kinase n=1 Tax=Microlunatus kandeliicorticis TaxID=1759536 RepID=A0A7W3IR70_9ACTN|nr:HAMP domain-containing sensor histidine kinase [Microlunatus kandeliicorticis]MBA8793733.1 signal transduction histidine kinase [Microlunatus kandeliicorticis]
MRTGLRLRITASIAAVVLVAVAGLAVAVHLLVIQNRIDAQRSNADAQIRAAIEIYQATDLLSFGAQVNDPALPSRLRDAVRADGARATLVTGGSTRELWAAGRSGSTVLSIRSTFAAVDPGVRAVDQSLLVAGVATVVLASLIGAGLATGLSRRLRLAAGAARAVSRGEDTSLRAAVGPGHDEVGALADAVDAMAERLAEQLRSEQRVTADVAHDLRTPVTGLAAAASLLDDSRPAQLVRDRVAALTSLVQDLLEVARLDTGVETAELEHVVLPELVRRSVDRGIATGEYPAGAVEVYGGGDQVMILTDPRRLDRVISNLVRNALRHGRAPVEIDTQAHRIMITDHGPGFSPEFLAAGPQRFRQDSTHRDGHGLGLIIATGQAGVLGARLSFQNAPEGGARVIIDLPGSAPRSDA